jgi:hypothetical protein
MTLNADRSALPLRAMAAVAAQTLGAAGPAQTIRPEVRAHGGAKIVPPSEPCPGAAPLGGQSR